MSQSNDQPIHEKLLSAARAMLGTHATGDPIPSLLYRTLEDSGVLMRSLPVDYRAFIDECAELGMRTDWISMRPGDVGVLQYAWDDTYWMYVITEVHERTYKVITAVFYTPSDSTQVVEQELQIPDISNLWHTNAILHFSIKQKEQ